MHPVIIENMGQKMRATVAGQITFINPEGK